ncbi:MAG TPA: hypothetical protein VK737_09090 [Opitutales bacterium]|nr:hypothetical protein [Opitutales bacterium]
MPAPAQPPPLPPGPPRPRAWVDLDRLTQPRPEERVAAGMAVLLTLLLHGGLFFWVIPWLGNLELAAEKNARYAESATITPTPPPIVYELQPTTPEDQKALRYVEVNPNAPDSQPVATHNISNRDQSAAQPTPDPNGQSDMPATNGTIANAPKIVSGDIQKPAPPPTPAPKPEASTARAAPPPTAPPPSQIAMNTPSLPGTISQSNGEGVMISDHSSDITSPTQTLQNLPNDTTAQKNYQLPSGPLTPQTVAASADAATPQDRPTAEIKTHSGPINKNSKNAHSIGVEASDAMKTNYGTYLALMYEAIGQEWDNECAKYSFDVRDDGSAVQVEFILNSKGEVVEAQVEDSNATAGATSLCLNAIKLSAPYGVWTPDMVALLGEQQQIKVTFFYNP